MRGNWENNECSGLLQVTGEKPSERNGTGLGLGWLGVQGASNFISPESATWLRRTGRFIDGDTSVQIRVIKVAT